MHVLPPSRPSLALALARLLSPDTSTWPDFFFTRFARSNPQGLTLRNAVQNPSPTKRKQMKINRALWFNQGLGKARPHSPQICGNPWASEKSLKNHWLSRGKSSP